MIRDGVHHDSEGEKMAAHDKYQEQQLSCAQNLAADASGWDTENVT